MHVWALRAAVVLVAVAAAGCGDPDAVPDGHAGSAEPSGSSTQQRTAWHACTVAAFRSAGTVLTDADLDGDGTRDQVRLVSEGSGPCSDALVARTHHGVAGVRLPEEGLDRDSAKVVELDPELVMVDGAVHPRGGYQTHLYALASSGALAEVTARGGPLLPFTSTDTGSAPQTATCTEDGNVAVWTATTHKPPGIVLAWDVRRTTYRIDGATAHPEGTELVEDGAADPLLRKQMPQLFQPHGYFADCRR